MPSADIGWSNMLREAIGKREAIGEEAGGRDGR